MHTITVEPDPVIEPDPEPEPQDMVEEVETEQNTETSLIVIVEMPESLTTEVTEEVAANMGKDATEAIAEDDSYSDEEKELAATTTEDTNAAIEEARGGELPDVDPAPSDSYGFSPRADDSTSLAETVGNANKESGQGSSAPLMGFNLNAGNNVPPEGGTAKATLPRQPLDLWGLILRAFKNAISGGNPGNVRSTEGLITAADATDDTETSNRDAVVFFDSNGKITNTIPTDTDEDGNPRIGGFMTMATFIEPGKNYDIVLSIPTEELEDNGVQTTTETKSVSLPTFHSSATSFFSTFVSADLIAGTNYYRISEDAIASKYNVAKVGDDWARTQEELAMATANSYTMITRLAEIDASAETATHTYIVAVNFSSDKIGRIDDGETGGFVFFPDGPASDPVAARVLKSVVSGDGYAFVSLTPAEILKGTRTGYLAFELPAGETFTKPMLAVYTVTPSQAKFTFSISKPSLTVKMGSTDTATITPANNSGDVTYRAYEGSTVLTWITFNNNAVTFAPTAATATAKTYNAYILGTDEANSQYSTDVTVTVTEEAGGGDEPGPGSRTD